MSESWRDAGGDGSGMYEKALDFDSNEQRGSTPTSREVRISSGGRTHRKGRRANRANAWSSDELRILRELASIGTPPEVIATSLRRTQSAVRNKAGMHGISLRGRSSNSSSP